MQTFAIVIRGNTISEAAFETLQSSPHGLNPDRFNIIDRFDAITSNDVDVVMEEEGLEWNYPWSGRQIDFSTGLIKSAYPTTVRNARIACALSHYMLWKKCRDSNEQMLILEHDAQFMEPLPDETVQEFYDSRALIASINSPLGATRKATLYHTKIRQSHGNFVPVPEIDDMKIPQGLPGNSAYMIKPAGAQAMIDLVANFGLWPNDAIMCRQLIHGLYCSARYYTRVQGTQSTTTL